MERRQRTNKDLESHLEEQIQFLEASAEAFDQGLEGEAKRLALIIRLLLHDTPKSHSLLGQLGRKGGDFWDSALPNLPGNQASYGGLVFMLMNDSGVRYVAMLDDVPQIKQVSFEKWWNAGVFTDDKQATFSRKSLVLTVVNQDGGAHVDPNLDEAYARLSQDNSMGYFKAGPEGTQPMPGPERAAIRQIAHELLKTLKPEYKKEIEYKGAHFSFMTVTSEPSTTQESGRRLKQVCRSSPKVGRNEKCPCGSGLKYKKCHGALI